jgi:3-deoxy-D-manno-octulosonic-acid transferase
MARHLYTFLLRLLAPLIWAWMARRARRSPGAWQILGRGRFGRYRAAHSPDSATAYRVWVHAVSLGETRAAQPLIRALLDTGAKLLLTHTTATGREEGARLFAAALAEGQLVQAWLPYDFPGAVRGFLRHFKPRLGIIIEREVWPNLMHETGRQGIPMSLVSARFSDSSLRQAARLGRLFRPAYAAFDLVTTQTVADAERLRKVGARNPRVLGSLKFDVSLSEAQVRAGRAWQSSVARPTVVVASTRDGEEAPFLDAIAERAHRSSEEGRDVGNVLHVVIPRHPQRFDAVASLIAASGLRYARRSEVRDEVDTSIQVLLGDTLGEMAYFYAAADVVIIGGGFAPLGGQNLIEACVAGTPVIVGPHMFNFEQATDDARAAGAAIQVDTPAAALRTAWDLLGNAGKRTAMREAALAWTARFTGATCRNMEVLRPWL